MKTVTKTWPPFRHEFYTIAARHAGTNTEVMGKSLKASIFSNSPHQIVTWDIARDWQDIIFGKEFISMSPAWSKLNYWSFPEN